MMSDAKAADLGKKMYEKIISETPVYTEQKLNKYVSDVGQRVVKNSDRPDDNYTFTILDNPNINAFATPGGYIYINRGLLAYMNSEAQLAAVLAHELAHITAEHAARQKRAQTGSNVIAGVFAILTGSAEVGEASAMWGKATVSGYGRDMELEADSIGAATLERAGYPRQAMIEIITQLKNHERFMKKLSKESGKKVQSYHGLFATHPRNDTRLLKIVNQSKNGAEAQISKPGDHGIVPFRVATEALPWGQGEQLPQQKDNRYHDNKLAFMIEYPAGWKFEKKTGQIIGQPEDKSATLTVDIKARTVDAPDLFIKKVLGIKFIRKSEPIIVSRLQGHTGIVAGKNRAADTRLAVIYYGRRAYVFKGRLSQSNLSKNNKQAKSLDDTHQTNNADNSTPISYDSEFKNIIASFQPQPRRRSAGQPAIIHYVKASAAATYVKLARQLHLGRYGADQLRLINGHYPGGEPRPGQWLKIIR